MLPLQGSQVQSLVGELRSHTCAVWPKKDHPLLLSYMRISHLLLLVHWPECAGTCLWTTPEGCPAALPQEVRSKDPSLGFLLLLLLSFPNFKLNRVPNSDSSRLQCLICHFQPASSSTTKPSPAKTCPTMHTSSPLNHKGQLAFPKYTHALSHHLR